MSIIEQSIHPRVQNKRVKHAKVNTSAKKQRGTLERVIAGIEKHLAEHPNDAVSAAHLAKVKAQL